MLHVILYCPEIPQNTGNIGRMCAITQSRLHLIHPLGFEITDKQLRRSGMDYWKELDVHHHENWAAFRASGLGPQGPIFLFTTKSDRPFWGAPFEDECGLLFGNEGHGVPEEMHLEFQGNRLKIPHWDTSLRSLNLATSVGIATYEALRKCVGQGTRQLPEA